MFIKNIITILPLLPANIGFVKRFSNSELHIFLFLYADFSLFYILYHKKGLPELDNPVIVSVSNFYFEWNSIL